MRHDYDYDYDTVVAALIPIAATAAIIIATIIAYHKRRQQNSSTEGRDSPDPVTPREMGGAKQQKTKRHLEGETSGGSLADDIMDAANRDASKCAACGKVGDDLKTCNGCKLVKYCDSSCQKAHRPKHKRECRERAAEILDAALFEQPPPREDCPICFLRLPPRTTVYQLCCGKTLCDGCMFAVAGPTGSDVCPFCRGRSSFSKKQTVERCEKRMAAGDAEAFNMLGCDYDDGVMGLPRDPRKALELWIRAGELGHEGANYNVACAYYEGQGVERNAKKAVKYYQLAAMGGHEGSRWNLGNIEYVAGNTARAMKHFVIAARAGDDDSMKRVGEGFAKGHVTKDEYEQTLGAHRDAQDEMKSDQRDRAIGARARENLVASLMGR
mmetsp:Transcript_676/g.1560  ORF Transcript_676/g.1560 Transcript_676/m.1560 type:complete len:383 (-) Transcript_676:83-1231(-)|eukprot:CAMPEP_0172531146 /NCGR_PEP_ID=MMETSP1067-20121228/4661_1 /TAXON_ID=265564 ORGANISM="Thalassiosira punctigera, Strain Tpunct2005C2" /NCGR_SAMPLE_ID=MMETSP1067 /ASSEMBLY_ACC=CAM_ASM_000444 /LENGTH=382 /DNA_ID=CAMNT_0013315489 /DNA_START=111 /DNA_END=1259 /DNA_ORIENTATION=-